MSNRLATVNRETLETKIKVSLNIDGTGSAILETGVPFFDHMLNQISRHGLIDLEIHAKGDLDIDEHHTIEDIGIALGQAFNIAIADKKGITRYGHAYVPLDESLSRVVIDISGRPSLEYNVQFSRSDVGGIDTDIIREFFQAFVNHSNLTVHIDNIRGINAHHIAETIFKAFGRALRIATEKDPRALETTPSTKGQL